MLSFDVALLLPLLVSAATVPIGFVETTVASGIQSPTAMAIAPDGRIFVCSQTGALRVIKNGTLLSAPFVSLSVDAAGERGLLGVAFDPNFAVNHYIYLYYTVSGNAPFNRVTRFTANGDIALAGSEKLILELNSLSSATNHNGGALHFGPDGKLYIAVGENANGTNSQTVSNLLGKILRLNSDGTIPSDNPFVQVPNARHEIWAMGLRNPFTFAFSGTTGLMYINDVGQTTWEEINLGQAAANYGWPSTDGPTNNSTYNAPLYYYGHSEGCAITGGAFYSPDAPNFPPAYIGKYFFADYCSGFIRILDPTTRTASGFATGAASPVDIQVGEDGTLYYLARGSESVMQIRYTDSLAPVITTPPASTIVTAASPAAFFVTAGGAAPFSYQWQKNGVNITGAVSAAYILSTPSLSDNGAQFRVRVANSHGSVWSTPARLTVTANRAPVGQISSPAQGTTYAGGTIISYSGLASDPEDGVLPPSAFTWQIDLHHDTHTHPFLAATSGSASGIVTIPDRGETSSNVFYRLILVVKDSGGLTHTTFRDITPRKSDLTFTTNPLSLQILLDGQPRATPFTVTGVEGIKRTIATVPQSLSGLSYVFQSWSDGRAATHEISTPTANTTYGARLIRGTQSTPPPPFCPCTIWPSTATPAVAAIADRTLTVELGIKFRSDVNGFVSGIRYYKSSTNSGTHVGTLWTFAGAKLAQATFGNETSSGWQQVNFSSPVAMTAGTTYVASYHTNSGYYAGDNNYFAANGIDRGPLHTLKDGENGGNGVYIYNADPTFPTQTFHSTNYWVDVVFNTTSAVSTTIWSPSATPTLAADGDIRSIEVGVKVRSDVNGSITGIRYYKSSANTGTHVASLWKADGTLLAQATFTSETNSGWQQVNFAAPVPITAETTYVASYHATNGHYAGDTFYFTNAGVDTGSLHALKDGVDGPNGVYIYSATSKFPTYGFRASNYWVDVVFGPP